MAFEVVVEAEALAELNQAADWYEEQNTGLGTQFIDAYLAIIEQIQTFPLACPLYRSNYRQAIMPRFPFVVIYLFSGDMITIIAVFHTSRNPEGKDR